jgi:hypothetical protein
MADRRRSADAEPRDMAVPVWAHDQFRSLIGVGKGEIFSGTLNVAPPSVEREMKIGVFGESPPRRSAEAGTAHVHVSVADAAAPRSGPGRCAFR